VSAQACPPVVNALRDLGAALDEVRLDEAAAVARAGQESLTCQPQVVSSLSLLSLFQLSGAVHMFLGDRAQAELDFGRAIAASPNSRLDPALGADAEEIYDAIRANTMTVQGGTLSVQGGVEAWVDGASVSADWPLNLTAGAHLLQVRSADGVLEGSTLRIAPSERREVRADGTVGLAAMGAVAAVGATGDSTATISGPDESGGTRWGLVVGGGVSLVAGGAALALASASHAAFESSEDYHGLETLQLRTNTFAISGLTLGALGAGMVGVGFALDGGPALAVGGLW
jgi:hypothetical protein